MGYRSIGFPAESFAQSHTHRDRADHVGGRCAHRAISQESREVSGVALEAAKCRQLSTGRFPAQCRRKWHFSPTSQPGVPMLNPLVAKVDRARGGTEKGRCHDPRSRRCHLSQWLSADRTARSSQATRGPLGVPGRKDSSQERACWRLRVGRSTKSSACGSHAWEARVCSSGRLSIS